MFFHFCLLCCSLCIHQCPRWVVHCDWQLLGIVLILKLPYLPYLFAYTTGFLFSSPSVLCYEILLQYQFYPSLNNPKDLDDLIRAGQHRVVGRASDSRARGPGFDTLSGHIHVLSFLFPLIQEGYLLVPGECMCTKYWLTA